jgi:putative ABC transport system permease protein
MVRSFSKLRAVDPGFDSENVITFGLILPATRYGNEDAAEFYLRLVERLRALPRVESAGVTTGLPVTPVQANYRMDIEDFPDGSDVFVVRWVTPGYFEAMGIPIASGRTMLTEDVEEFRLFISASLAEQYWSTSSAVGRRMGPGGNWADIVGVVGDDRIRGLDVPVEGGAYVPIGVPFSPSVLSVSVVVRTSDAVVDLLPPLRREVGLLDPELPLINVRSMEEVIANSYAVSRTTFAALLLVVAATVALLLGGIGIYGLIAYAVSRRTSEIGIRMALGATAAQIWSRVVGAELLAVAIGIALGLAAATLGSRVMASLLFETSPLDPATLFSGPLAFLLVATAAAAVPAARALRIDPVSALRSE